MFSWWKWVYLKIRWAFLAAILQWKQVYEHCREEEYKQRQSGELQTKALTAPLLTAHLRQVNNFYYLPCCVMEKLAAKTTTNPKQVICERNTFMGVALFYHRVRTGQDKVTSVTFLRWKHTGSSFTFAWGALRRHRWAGVQGGDGRDGVIRWSLGAPLLWWVHWRFLHYLGRVGVWRRKRKDIGNWKLSGESVLLRQ